jgi:hypothetical protein
VCAGLLFCVYVKADPALSNAPPSIQIHTPRSRTRIHHIRRPNDAHRNHRTSPPPPLLPSRPTHLHENRSAKQRCVGCGTGDPMLVGLVDSVRIHEAFEGVRGKEGLRVWIRAVDSRETRRVEMTLREIVRDIFWCGPLRPHALPNRLTLCFRQCFESMS